MIMSLGSVNRGLWAGLLTALALAVGTGMSSADERLAGTVLAVSPARRAVELDGFGANAKRQILEVKVSPDALILVSERNAGASEFDQPFNDTPIGLREIQVGDFVVVRIADKHDVADLVIVTLRRGAGAL